MRFMHIDNDKLLVHWLQCGLFPRRGHKRQTDGTDTACTTAEFSFAGCAKTCSRMSQTPNWIYWSNGIIFGIVNVPETIKTPFIIIAV